MDVAITLQGVWVNTDPLVVVGAIIALLLVFIGKEQSK